MSCFLGTLIQETRLPCCEEAQVSHTDRPPVEVLWLAAPAEAPTGSQMLRCFYMILAPRCQDTPSLCVFLAKEPDTEEQKKVIYYYMFFRLKAHRIHEHNKMVVLCQYILGALPGSQHPFYSSVFVFWLTEVATVNPIGLSFLSWIVSFVFALCLWLRWRLWSNQ